MTHDQLQTAIKQREADIANYQVNIDNYTAIIDMLPTELPSRLVEHRNTAPVDLIKTFSFHDIQLLSDFQFRDKLSKMLLTERLEQRKSAFVLKALQLKITP
jgi:hypothetical protein